LLVEFTFRDWSIEIVELARVVQNEIDFNLVGAQIPLAGKKIQL